MPLWHSGGHFSTFWMFECVIGGATNPGTQQSKRSSECVSFSVLSAFRIFIDLHLHIELKPLRPDQIGRSLEMMAGVASFSISLSVLGWQAYVMDTLYRVDGHNLLNVFVQERILRMVAAGVWAIIHEGLVCTSWSRLANPPYRSIAEIDGLASLCKEKKEWVADQNKLHQFSMQVLNVATKTKVRICAREQKILASVENGDTTMVWSHPRTLQTCTVGESHDAGFFHRTALCRWGTKWRKTTRIWATRHIPGIQLRCFCKKPHGEVIKGSVKVQLSSKRWKWISRSKISAAYPPRLCDAWAASIDTMFRQ